MNRTLRRTLVALCLLCGLFVTGYLGRAAAQRPAAAPPTGPVTLEQLQGGLPSPSPALAGGPGPRLVADEREHDFGMVMQGSKSRHVFAIRNVGDREARIEAVRSSCGCTATVLSQKVVPPGGRTEVQAEFSAGSARGRFHKTIRVLSDDPASPLVLGVAGKVLPKFRVEPELTLFGRVKPGTEVRRRVRIVAADPGVPFRGGPALGSNLALEAGPPRPVPGEPGVWSVELVARPRDASANLTGVLMLPTGDALSPYASVRVAGEVEGAP